MRAAPVAAVVLGVALVLGGRASRAQEAPTYLVHGVAFEDRNRNLRFDKGEGIGGAGLSLDGGLYSGTAHATTDEGGAWSIVASPGLHLLHCSGVGFRGLARALVEVVDRDVRVDFHSGLDAGEVDLGWQEGGMPAGPEIAVAATPTSGVGPLDLDVTVAGGGSGTRIQWSVVPFGFIDNWPRLGLQLGPGPGWQFAATLPGTFPTAERGVENIYVDAMDSTGIGSALATVFIYGSGGGGPGTTPPSSNALVATTGALVADFRGGDSSRTRLSFRGTIELPAGYSLPAEGEESPPVIVSLAGNTMAFYLDAHGRGQSTGNSWNQRGVGAWIQIKAPWPDDGAGVPAGTMATVQVTGFPRGVWGFGAGSMAMRYAGLRNRTERRTIEGVPIGLLLNDQPYVGTASFDVRSVAGVGAKARLVR